MKIKIILIILSLICFMMSFGRLPAVADSAETENTASTNKVSFAWEGPYNTFISTYTVVGDHHYFRSSDPEKTGDVSWMMLPANSPMLLLVNSCFQAHKMIKVWLGYPYINNIWDNLRAATIKRVEQVWDQFEDSRDLEGPYNTFISSCTVVGDRYYFRSSDPEKTGNYVWLTVPVGSSMLFLVNSCFQAHKMIKVWLGWPHTNNTGDDLLAGEIHRAEQVWEP